jgi:prepilin-type N-terminal cleavage/methylation domain-containing protein
MKRGIFMLIRLRKIITNQKGFTLIELLVVVSILGILAAIVVPKFTDATARANTAKIAADLRSLDSAIAMEQATRAIDPANIATLVNHGYLAATPVVPTGAFLITGSTSSTAISATTYTFNATPSTTTTTSTLRATFQGNTADFYH